MHFSFHTWYLLREAAGASQGRDRRERLTEPGPAGGGPGRYRDDGTMNERLFQRRKRRRIVDRPVIRRVTKVLVVIIYRSDVVDRFHRCPLRYNFVAAPHKVLLINQTKRK